MECGGERVNTLIEIHHDCTIQFLCSIWQQFHSVVKNVELHRTQPLHKSINRLTLRCPMQYVQGQRLVHFILCVDYDDKENVPLGCLLHHDGNRTIVGYQNDLDDHSRGSQLPLQELSVHPSNTIYISIFSKKKSRRIRRNTQAIY